MRNRLTRRGFHARLRLMAQSVLPLVTMIACSRKSTTPESQATGWKEKAKGYLKVTRGGPDLQMPPDTPPGEIWRYGLAIPFQVAPRRAAIFCNIRKDRGLGADFEVGTDVIIFDSLSDIRADQATPVSRNHEQPNPRSQPPGARSVIVKYPVRGGFVPFGARRADGTPHPYAGTGFGLCQALAWPLGQPALDDIPDRRGQRPFRESERYEYLELKQYTYDGKTFGVVNEEKIQFSDLLAGWTFTDPGISSAIPDGDDLLLPIAFAETGAFSRGFDGEECSRLGLAFDRHEVGSGVMRWRRDSGAWRPVSFVPVTGEDNSFEPTLIRDVDGSLLLTARGGRESTYNDIQIWRSKDGGRSWNKIIHVRGVISSAPISINRAADGTPYIAANLYEVLMYPTDPYMKLPPDPVLVHLGYMHKVDIAGRDTAVRGGGWLREKICLWPLNADRTGLELPIIARDCHREFGPPPGGSTWNADHPSAATVRLGDGAWHDILGYRVVERGEITYGMDPAPQTGAYLEEVDSAGGTIPAWNFSAT